MYLLQQLDPAPLASPDTRRRPFADPIDCDNGSTFEWRREKSRAGVRLMVLRKNDRAFVTEFFAQTRFEPDFFFHPNRHRFPKRRQAARRACEISREQPFEFQKRFFVERNEIELTRAGEIGFAQTVVDRMPGESGVV